MAVSDYLPFLAPPEPRFITESGAPVHGIMARIPTPADAIRIAKEMNKAGFADWDIHCPYPMHGLDEAMGVKRTILPIHVAIAAFTGVAGALAMQWWMNYLDYPTVVQGKPFDAWEPFVPITFELGVLFSAFAALIGMLALNGLPRFNHPLFRSEKFLYASDDAILVVVEAKDPKFDPQATKATLESLGCTEIELVEDES
jgi:hypothetical protein